LTPAASGASGAAFDLKKEVILSSFGLYPWFAEHGDDLVHPEDQKKLLKLTPYGKVFELVSSDSDYIELSYGEESYRVKPDLYLPIPEIRHRIGDNLERHGEDHLVRDIRWHFQKRQVFYLVYVNGKKSSRRYFEDEF
jgi:hypothetical protein